MTSFSAGVADRCGIPNRAPLPAQLVEGANRCLVVANTFPPIHGGSAIVYDSLARFGGGRVSVLAPQEDYRDGWPIQGWREFDRRAPFKVHRIRLLRTLFLPEDASALQRVGGLAADLAIRLSVLRSIWRIVRTEKIAVLCIGELVAGGWLAGACRRLFGLKTVIYIHGEEISTRTRYDEGGQRRRRALRGGGRDRRGQPVHAGHADRRLWRAARENRTGVEWRRSGALRAAASAGAIWWCAMGWQGGGCC